MNADRQIPKQDWLLCYTQVKNKPREDMSPQIITITHGVTFHQTQRKKALHDKTIRNKFIQLQKFPMARTKKTKQKFGHTTRKNDTNNWQSCALVTNLSLEQMQL